MLSPEGSLNLKPLVKASEAGGMYNVAWLSFDVKTWNDPM